MATGTTTWTPTNGSSYEVWYGKLSVVGTTSLPPTTGWTEAIGSPFASTLGIATITGLDDNTQYRIVARGDCTSSDSGWIDNTKDKLVCPSLSVVANPVPGDAIGASITATITLTNLVEFETIATTITLVVKKTSDATIVATKVFSAPYSGTTLTNLFDNLLTGTGYTVYLSIHDGVHNVDATCSNQAVTTLNPVTVPPPICTAPTFTITNIGASGFTINITSSILTGDTYDVSVNSGANYAYTGFTTSPILITGLTALQNYTVVLRRNCGAGGVGYSTSQTVMTGTNAITGVITMDATSSSGQSPVTMRVVLSAISPNPVVLYMGYTWQNQCNPCPGGSCKWSNGYDIFTPAPTDQNCIGLPTGSTYSGPPHLPFVVTIPANTLSFTATNIYTTLGNPGPSGGVINPWQNLNGVSTPQYGFRDLYVKVNSPTGKDANFSIVDGIVVKGVVIHNV